MGWWIAFTLLVLLGFAPLGIIGEYQSAGANAWLTVGPFRYRIYPRKKVAGSYKRDTGFEKKKEGSAVAQKKKTAGSVSDFLPLVDNVFSLLVDFRKHLQIRILRMHLVLAEEDPCDLAMHYGDAWAALGNLIPLLEQNFRIRKRDMTVSCDFTAEKTKIYAYVHGTISLGGLLWLVIYHGLKGINKFNQLKGKGGANHESEAS